MKMSVHKMVWIVTFIYGTGTLLLHIKISFLLGETNDFQTVGE